MDWVDFSAVVMLVADKAAYEIFVNEQLIWPGWEKRNIDEKEVSYQGVIYLHSANRFASVAH